MSYMNFQGKKSVLISSDVGVICITQKQSGSNLQETEKQ